MAAHLRTIFPSDGEEVTDVIARHYLDALHAIPDAPDVAEIRGQLYLSLIACIFTPWGIGRPDAGPSALALGLLSYLGKLAIGALLLALFETSIAKMRVFRVPEFLGAGLMLGLLATLLLFVSRSL